MAIQLVTDQLSNVVDDKFRSQFVGNFKVTETTLNSLIDRQQGLSREMVKLASDIADDVNHKISEQDKAIVKRLTEQSQELTARINRITLGTDEDTIRLVVTAILQEQGVIK
ncbi:hypothetical protein ACWPXM_06520 [Lactiplantibacillus plantarum]